MAGMTDFCPHGIIPDACVPCLRAELANVRGDLAARIAAELPSFASPNSRLSAVELAVLLALDRPTATLLGVLIEKLRLPRTTVTDTVSRLRRRGFVSRKMDQRSAVLSLTPQGRQLRRRARGRSKHSVGDAARENIARDAIRRHTRLITEAE